MSSIKAIAAKIFAKIIRKKMRRWIDNPIEAQAKVFDDLIEKAKSTKFGQDHNFSEVKTHSDFIERVPVRDYEGLKKYTEKMLNGDPDVL
jgi:hypothetical protein